MKHLEIKTIEHKGTKIVVKIDYDNETVSLVEQGGKSNSGYAWPAKQWVFNNRGIEYMNGWIVIVDAIKFAIEEAKKDLQEFLDAKAKEKEDMMIKVALEKDK